MHSGIAQVRYDASSEGTDTSASQIQWKAMTATRLFVLRNRQAKTIRRGR